MKVGTDGVLLGSWTDISHHAPDTAERTFSILDIGTGTGLISLMLAQRAAEAGMDFHIDAVEIDEEAAQQAQENIAASSWASRISVFPLSLQAFQQNDTPQAYDLIVCNPPFYNATLKPDDAGRAVARHKDALPVANIAKYAANHLTAHGRLSLIYPTDYDSEVMTATILCSLHPVRICDILTKVSKPCKRRMAEFSLQNTPLSRERLIIRNAEGKYTDAYRSLTAEFYLHLTD